MGSRIQISTLTSIFCSLHQRVLFNQLSDDGDEFNSKEAQLLVSILGVLSQQLDPSSDQVPALYHQPNRTTSIIRTLIILFFFSIKTWLKTLEMSVRRPAWVSKRWLHVYDHFSYCGVCSHVYSLCSFRGFSICQGPPLTLFQPLLCHDESYKHAVGTLPGYPWGTGRHWPGTHTHTHTQCLLHPNIDEKFLCWIRMWRWTNRVTLPSSTWRLWPQRRWAFVGAMATTSSSSPSSSLTFVLVLQLLVMSQVDRVLDEVDWLIARRKNQTTVNKSGPGGKPLHICDENLSTPASLILSLWCVGEATQTAAQQDKVEKTVMLQLGKLLTGLHELVQTSLPQGSSIVAVLRVLTRTYNILTTLAKYVRACPLSHDCLNLDFRMCVKLFPPTFSLTSTSRYVRTSRVRSRHASRNWWVFHPLLTPSCPSDVLLTQRGFVGEAVRFPPDATVLHLHHVRTGTARSAPSPKWSSALDGLIVTPSKMWHILLLNIHYLFFCSRVEKLVEMQMTGRKRRRMKQTLLHL